MCNFQKKQKYKLRLNWENGLKKVRKKAVLWHNTQKQNRLEEARKAALEVLRRISFNDRYFRCGFGYVIFGGGNEEKRRDGYRQFRSSDIKILHRCFAEDLQSRYFQNALRALFEGRPKSEYYEKILVPYIKFADRKF